MNFFLGVDGGNTKTTFLLCDEKGKVISYTRKGGTNPQSCGGIEEMLEILNEGIKEISSESKIDRKNFISYFGMAGADRESDFKMIKSALARLGLRSFDLQNDGFIALRSGTLDGKGILITCGTGNTNFASNGREVKRVGGLSPALGDGLGTNLIAFKATSAAVRAKDGRGPNTILKNIIEDKLKMEVEDLISINIKKEDPVPLVIESLFEAAEKFDMVALSILKDAIEEISRIADIFRFSLFPKRKKVKLILDGPFFKHAHSFFFESLKHYSWEGYQIVVPQHDPVVGAVLLAMERERIDSKNIAKKVIREYLRTVKKEE